MDGAHKGKRGRWKNRHAPAEDATNKIMLAFQSGGIIPLEVDQPAKYAQVREHVRSILSRAMESKREKKRRKWENFQRVQKEAAAVVRNAQP